MTKDYKEKIRKYYLTLEANQHYNYKNFKELCNAIGIDYASSDSKKAILNILNIYCLIERTKNSHSIIITKRDEFLIVPSKKQKRRRLSEYAKTMYPIFLNLFKNKDSVVLQSYRNQLFISFGFAKNNMFKYEETKNSNAMILDEFRQNCYGIIIQPFTRAINNLDKNCIITCSECYMVEDSNDESGSWRIATPDEQKIIKSIFNNALFEYHCNSMYQVYVKTKKKIFEDRLNNQIKLKYPTIRYRATSYIFVFSTIEIEYLYQEYNKFFGKMTDSEIENKIDELRKSINNRILPVVQKYNDREIQEFIYQRSEKKKEIFKQLKEDYGDEMTLEECTAIYKSLLEEYTNNIIKLD